MKIKLKTKCISYNNKENLAMSWISNNFKDNPLVIINLLKMTSSHQGIFEK